MTSKIETAAELSAALSAEAHFIQSSKSLRPKFYAVPRPHIIGQDALALMRIGASVERWAVKACNGVERWEGGRWVGSWTEADEKAKERADARALAKAQVIGDRYGATVKIGGDPRGYTLRLMMKSNATNSSAGDGWGVA
jgi:hypothetical protein